MPSVMERPSTSRFASGPRTATSSLRSKTTEGASIRRRLNEKDWAYARCGTAPSSSGETYASIPPPERAHTSTVACRGRRFISNSLPGQEHIPTSPCPLRRGSRMDESQGLSSKISSPIFKLGPDPWLESLSNTPPSRENYPRERKTGLGSAVPTGNAH